MPTFNIFVNVWRATAPPPGAPASTLTANLMMGLSRTNETLIESLASQLSYMYVLLPKGVDVRGWWDGSTGDYIEAPAGSSRFYAVNAVDDVSKGFPSEYRVAFCQQVTDPLALFGIPFPVPLP